MRQRSYLFPTGDAHGDTTRLIATAASATGFMKGAPGAAPQGWYRPGADNRAVLAALHATLAASYPAAGPPLWAVRLWTNLLWQPAYLAVIAVHLQGAVPDLRGMSQQRRGLYIDGFRLAPGPCWSGPVPAMIERAARQLKTLADDLLVEVNGLEKLRPVLAQRLFADRMLGLMVWLGHKQRDLTMEQIQAHAAHWMALLELTGQGALQAVEADGRRLLIVQRKGCCLDYLIEPARLCANCPRQGDALRIARQTANALAELA